MRKMMTGIFEVVFLFCISTAFPYNWSTNPGTGEPNTPYQISTAEQLISLGSNPSILDKSFILMNDIDLDPNLSSEYNFSKAVIASGNTIFTGDFNGNNKKILNLKITHYISGIDYCDLGLFGTVREPARIYDLELLAPIVKGTAIPGETDASRIGGLAGTCYFAEINNCSCHNVTIAGEEMVGGLIGTSSFSQITNCSVSGSVVGGVSVGGLIGKNRDDFISNCFVDAHIEGGYICGGLIGWNFYHASGLPWGMIIDCHTSGEIITGTEVGSPNGICFGGLVGSNDNIIMNCYSTMSVSGCYANGGLVGSNSNEIHNSYAIGDVISVAGNAYDGWIGTGGLVGVNEGNVFEIGMISNCYAKGNVTGVDYVGGLAGRNHGTISHSYSMGTVLGEQHAGGLTAVNEGTIAQSYWDLQTSGIAQSGGGIGLNSNLMKKSATFSDWDFITTWSIGEKQTYPYLRKYAASDINQDHFVNLLDMVILSEEWLTEK